MKNKMLLSLITFFFVITTNAADNPLANPEAIVISGDMRFTILTPEMIRIEWRSSEKFSFEDHATFAIVNRNLPVPAFTTREEDGFLYIETEKLTLKYRVGSFPGTFNPASSQNLKITFQMDGRTVTWYPWKKDTWNLKGTARTLDGANGDNKRGEMENGIISRSGWAVIDDTETRSDGSKSLLFQFDEVAGFDWVTERKDKAGMDWYFMGYGHDYKKALYDFTRIAGKIPMPPIYAFGYWYSKYQKYSDQDFKNLVLDIEDHDIPLDIMVIDTDWHINGWTGWSWNRDLFPDPEGFIQWMHNKQLKTTLNLHPAYGVDSNEDNFDKFIRDLGGVPSGTNNVEWNLENPRFYSSLFTNILRPHEDIGIDFWWIDWQQWLLSKTVEGLGNTFWINYVFFTDMEKHRESRSMIFHRWGGLGNHRYQIGFSGDAHANFETLAFQPYFTSTASNVGYGYWSHDIGGHYQPGDNNPELYLRWIQFGIFSPIIRTHSTNAPNIERRIWKYPNFTLMKEALDLRYALIPYIYTQARKAYDTGISICRPLYYDYPENSEAYIYENEYMFGDDILVNPITEAAGSDDGLVIKDIWLPEGDWYEACTGQMLEGNKLHKRLFGQADIPYYYRSGAIIPEYPKIKNLNQRPGKLIVKFIPGATGEMKLYEDEGNSNNYQIGKYSFTRITQTNNEGERFYTIHPVEGEFEGMLSKRSYDIELLATSQPYEVKVNNTVYFLNSNQEAGTWKYDAVNSIIHIYLPEISCAERTDIRVRFQTTGFEEVKKVSPVQINYNRKSEQLRVNLPESNRAMTLQIYNSTGQLVSTDAYSMQQEICKPLSGLPAGCYLVTVLFDNKKYIDKFIK